MHRFPLFLSALLVLRCSAEPALGRDGRDGREPAASWMHRYEGTVSVQRSLIAALPDGGFVAGVQGQGPPNAILVMDGSGNVKASRKLDPYELSSLSAGPDGSIYAGIRSPDRQSSESLRLVKFRADLSVVWTRRFTTAEGAPVGMGRAAGTRDGGVAVVGGHNGASIVAKLNRDGAVEWATGIDASDAQGFEMIRQTRDGGYVAAGSSPRWAWLVKLGADGAVLWQRSYGPQTGLLRSVIENQDGALMVLGSFGGAAMITKTTSRGDVVWSKVSTIPGEGLSLVAGGVAGGEAGVAEAADAIVTMSAGDTPDTMQIASIRPDGSLRWQRTFQPGGGIMWNEFENAMLAVTKGQVAFAAALGRELAVFAGSVAEGPGGCAWFTDGKVELTDTALREEEVAVERFRAPIVARDAAVQFAPLAIRAVAESCPPPLGSGLSPVPTRPMLAFRVPGTTAQTKAYAALLVAGKFAELEETAAKLRKDKPSADPLRPNLALRTFYQAFENNEAAPVKARLERLREWRAAHPQSVTARLALAGVLYRAAWNIRGADTADTVTASAGEAYDELLDEARRVIEGLGDDVDDPYYWYVRINLTRELGLGDVRETGLKALARYPDPLIASRVARYLYPQWGGSPEMYMQFAGDATRVTKARYGEAMYLWLVYGIENYETSDDYKQYTVDWSRVLQGGEDLLRMNPDWPPSYHLFAELAHKYDDEKTLRTLFPRPQLEWYEGADELWAGREVYEYVRRNALPAPPVPVSVPPQQPPMDAPILPAAVVSPRPVPPNIARAPSALLESEVTVGGNVQRNLAAFLVATTEGVVAVSAGPEPLSSGDRPFESWTLWSPTDGKKRTHTGPFLTTKGSSNRRGVAMRLQSKEAAGAQPLKPAREQPQFSDPVFVIVCRRPHGRCEETALAATLVVKNISPGVITYELELADPPAENEAIGAAVVNERREVFAVVTLRMTDARWPGQVKLQAESLGNFIPGL